MTGHRPVNPPFVFEGKLPYLPKIASSFGSSHRSPVRQWGVESRLIPRQDHKLAACVNYFLWRAPAVRWGKARRAFSKSWLKSGLSSGMDGFERCLRIKPTQRFPSHPKIKWRAKIGRAHV